MCHFSQYKKVGSFKGQTFLSVEPGLYSKWKGTLSSKNTLVIHFRAGIAQKVMSDTFSIIRQGDKTAAVREEEAPG